MKDRYALLIVQEIGFFVIRVDKFLNKLLIGQWNEMH